MCLPVQSPAPLAPPRAPFHSATRCPQPHSSTTLWGLAHILLEEGPQPQWVTLLGSPHPGVPHRGQVPWAAHTTASSLRQHLGQAREAQRTDHSYLRAPPSPPQLPAPPPSGLDIHWMLCPVEHAPLLLVKTTQARTLSTHPPPIRTPCPPTPGPSTPSWPLTCPLCPLQEGVLRPPC